MIDIFSKIDSDRFNLKIGRATWETFKDDPPSILNSLSDYDLIIARLDMNNVKSVNIMEDLGFRIKDHQITYKFNLNKNDVDNIPKYSEYVIRDFRELDVDTIVKISRESFYGYGHYFANNSLDINKCNEIYPDWAYNICTNPNLSDKILVAEHEGCVIGFLSFKIYESGDFKYAAGGIGTVDHNYRGRDIFPDLILEGLKWGSDIGLDWEEHNVIVNNFPVNRSMNKLGFKQYNPITTMHYTKNKL